MFFFKKNKCKNIIYLNINIILKFLIFIIIFILFDLIPKNKIKKEIKVCLCVIGKKENKYIKEFINHYKLLGYDHIYIYDNNNIDDERMDQIINNSNFITIIDYRNNKSKNLNWQYKAYYDCYKNNNRKYDWLSFFDFDEFLEIIPKNQTIKNFLNNEKYIKCQNIKINWLLYSSSEEILNFINKPMKERFKKPMFNDGANIHIKSTVRGSLTKNYWTRWENSHSSIDTFKSCSSSGKSVSGKSAYINPPDYKYAFLKHYYYKSFEEYCLKLKRGWPDPTNQTIWINNLLKDNRHSKEKLKIIKKILNLTIVN